jgi:hypothetical protein
MAKDIERNVKLRVSTNIESGTLTKMDEFVGRLDTIVSQYRDVNTNLTDILVRKTKPILTEWKKIETGLMEVTDAIKDVQRLSRTQLELSLKISDEDREIIKNLADLKKDVVVSVKTGKTHASGKQKETPKTPEQRKADSDAESAKVHKKYRGVGEPIVVESPPNTMEQITKAREALEFDNPFRFLAKGDPFIKKDQLAFLHRGEAVVPADLNDQFKNIKMYAKGSDRDTLGKMRRLSDAFGGYDWGAEEYLSKDISERVAKNMFGSTKPPRPKASTIDFGEQFFDVISNIDDHIFELVTDGIHISEDSLKDLAAATVSQTSEEVAKPGLLSRVVDFFKEFTTEKRGLLKYKTGKEKHPLTKLMMRQFDIPLKTVDHKAWQKKIEEGKATQEEYAKAVEESEDYTKDWIKGIRKWVTGALISIHVLKVWGQWSPTVEKTTSAFFRIIGYFFDVILRPLLPAFVFVINILAGAISTLNRVFYALEKIKFIGPAIVFTISLISAYLLSLLAFGSVNVFKIIGWLKRLIFYVPEVAATTGASVNDLAGSIENLGNKAEAANVKLNLGGESKGVEIEQLATGGRLTPGQTAIVGERGPELLTPSGSGFNVIPNGGFRMLAEGTTTLGTLTGGLLGVTSSGVTAAGELVSSTLQDTNVQNILGSIRMLAQGLGAVLAPLSGVIAIGGIMTAGFIGMIKATKKSGQSITSAIFSAASSIRTVLMTQLLFLTKLGVAGAAAVGGGLMLGALWDELMAAWEAVKALWGWLTTKWEELVTWFAGKLDDMVQFFAPVWNFLGELKNTILRWMGLEELIGREWDFLGWIKEKVMEYLGFPTKVETPGFGEDALFGGTGVGGRSGDQGGSPLTKLLAMVTARSFGNSLFGGGLFGAKALSKGGFISPEMEEYFTWQKSKYGQGWIQSYQTGGLVPETGPAYLHKGETVIPAGGGAGNNIYINNPTFVIHGRDDKELFDNFMKRMRIESNRTRGVI